MSNESKQNNVEQKSALELIAEQMLKRQVREDAAEELSIADRARKIERRAAVDQSLVESEHATQRNCSHKQGRTAFKQVQDMYNLYGHYLVDGSVFVKCRSCHMQWNRSDTREFLIVNGKKVANHTGKSFLDIWEKVPKENISRSEVTINTSVPVLA